MKESIRVLLNQAAARYEHVSFIDTDPISIPHRYTAKQDIEIAGFFSAILAWGNRASIIRSADSLLTRMDHDPYRFVKDASKSDLKRLEGFVHRTFNTTDLLYLVDFLNQHYRQFTSLEEAFFPISSTGEDAVELGLTHFHHRVFNSEFVSERTRKHIATPERGSACKRLNMFLRWMVRPADGGVDFGIWKRIKPAQLICPLDVHVHRVALDLGIITRQQADWRTALQLTKALSELDKDDPVRFDYALFMLGVEKNGTKKP
ncbi:MAG: TIGR02757 family protein [Flavobacteriales bacterium]|nr:TIGR02757 family protein [Flavobacteriales bacterium]